jgi:hypothetical protein
VSFAADAAAQNPFSALFGPPPARPAASQRAPSTAYAEPGRSAPSSNPFAALFGIGTTQQPQHTQRHGGGGGPVAYCVRLCDGRYFPLQRTPNATPVEMCQAFCPATATEIYNGGPIDTAVARNGSRYADLDTAYAYRDSISSECSCNGKDSVGLAPIAAAEDPTLKPGDIVATKAGLVAYEVAGASRRRAAATGSFTPIADYPGLSRDLRDKLTATEIAPE